MRGSDVHAGTTSEQEPENEAESSPSDHSLYDAFASYATDPDRDLVRDVEAFIEALHRNPLVDPSFRRELELCVDGSDFKLPRRSPRTPSANDADPVLELVVAHLRQSRRFVLFVGPRSRDHPWINYELGWWLDNRNPEEVLIAVSHGHDPVSEREITFPDRVLELGLDRFVWFDLRGYRGREPNARSLRLYEEERLKLAGAMMEPPAAPSDLIESWRAAARRRRRRNLVAGTVAAAVLLAAVAGGITASLRGLDSAREARASGLALMGRQSSEIAANRHLDALAYAASSLATEPTPQGYAALVRTARLLPAHLWTIPHDRGGKAVDAVAFLAEDQILASAGYTGVLQFARADTGANVGSIELAGRATTLRQHPTRPLLAIATQRGVDFGRLFHQRRAAGPTACRACNF